MATAADTIISGDKPPDRLACRSGQANEDASAAPWPPGDGRMCVRIREHDWTATPLGPIPSWPAELRSAAVFVLESAFPAALVWGAGLVTLYNDGFLPLLNDKPEALGRSFADVWSEAWDRIGPIAERALRGEAACLDDFPLLVTRASQPEQAYFTFACHPVRSADGSVAGLIDTAVETTGRVHAAAALRQSQALLAAVFDALPVGVGVGAIDAEGRVLAMNPEMRRFLPTGVMPSRDAVRRGRWQASHPDGRPVAPKDFPGARALRGERVVPGLEMRYTPDDGRSLWTRVAAVPIRDAQESVTGEVVVVTDIDAIKRGEEALRRAVDELAAADRRKDEFLATLAHELRNPLAPIVSALRLLRSEAAGIDRAALGATVERQVGHLVRLVDDLMDASRISRGAVELRREPLDLREVLRTAVETSRPAIEGGRHAFALELPGEPLPVDGDAVRLGQVVANLLDNAARYTDDGGHIELAARRDGVDAVVTVRDDGIGIAPGQLSHVFELFTQLHGSRARSHGGLGVGLGLAQRLAQLHGGSLAAASDGPDRGSTFTVRLPLAALSTAPASAALPADTAGLKVRPILIVDDNRDAAETLALLLGTFGAETRVECDGASALALLQRWRPAAVLLDLGMPGMDGFEVARRIRADASLDGVLLVALTGWGQASDRQRTREAGFDHHLTKPVALDALLALLEALPSPAAVGGAKA